MTRTRPWDVRTVILLSAVAACVILFVRIVREVAERETQAFDVRILEAIHAVSSPPLVFAAQLLSDLGPPIGVTVVALFAALAWWRAGRRVAAYVFVAGFAVTAALNTALKDLFGRARPDLWPHAAVSGDSFPSGHAMQSTMVYGTLAVLCARRWPERAQLFYTLAVLLIAGITASRAVLGVHWPTDLIAGVAMGSICLVLTVWAIDVAERRAGERR